MTTDLTDWGASKSSITATANRPVYDARKPIIVILAILALGMLTIIGSRWPNGTFLHESIECFGTILICICIIGRTSCSLYISGRKQRQLVEDGPYSICRNPLYFFSIIGAVGMGAQFGSFAVPLMTGLLTWAIFRWVVRNEEIAMLAAFPVKYRSYMARVPRFFPKITLWQTPATITVKPLKIHWTSLDSLLLLLIIPIKELLDYLHDTGVLPVYLLLP